jgi:(p)ppGpp synthase/HD superfamily hydrolase
MIAMLRTTFITADLTTALARNAVSVYIELTEPAATRTDASLAEALEFAREAHAGQFRKQNGSPYIEHPIAVTELLTAAGFEDDVLVAAYLHDVVEKTETAPHDIEERFGADVTAVVAALTENNSIPAYAARKRALRENALSSGKAAIVVYSADRLANMRDWHALDDTERAAAAKRLGTSFEERMTLWEEDLEALSALQPEPPLLGEIEIELRALREG